MRETPAGPQFQAFRARWQGRTGQGRVGRVGRGGAGQGSEGQGREGERRVGQAAQGPWRPWSTGVTRQPQPD